MNTFPWILGVHLIGVLITVMAGISGNKDGLICGLGIIFVSDVLLIIGGRYEQRNGRIPE
jgi:hypothetical protein